MKKLSTQSNEPSKYTKEAQTNKDHTENFTEQTTRDSRQDLFQRSFLTIPTKMGKEMDTTWLKCVAKSLPTTKEPEEKIDDIFGVFERYFKMPVLAILTDFNMNPTNVLISFDTDKTGRFYVDVPTNEELLTKKTNKFKNICYPANTDGLLLVPLSKCREFLGVSL